MPETAQQYIARILGNVEGKEPLEVLAQSPLALEKLLAGVPADVLSRRPAPGKWSIKEIVFHLADAELVVAARVRFMLGAPGTPIAAFDQDAWVAAQRYNDRNVRAALDAYRAIRAINLQLYRTLTPDQWELYGLHSERGRESVRQIVTLSAGHDLNHLKQISGLLATSSAAR